VAATLPGWRLRTVSLTMEAPFVSHLATMADSGVVVARHGPILANAVFLPPGAVVMELLPYKWEWQQISRLYFNTTQSTGYIHHFAWRPQVRRRRRCCCRCCCRCGQGQQLPHSPPPPPHTHTQQAQANASGAPPPPAPTSPSQDVSACVYTDAGDVRYSSWTYEECFSRECLVVHARAGLTVDVDAVRATLLDKLPQVLAGATVESLREEWPQA
jgi:hypothetical protein